MSLHVDGMGASTQLSQGRIQRVETFEGQTLTACSYDLKGRLKRETLGNGATVDYGYEGDGLYYARARSYDAGLGRFLSPDPAGQQYDINLYRYAGNNPVMNGDITGKAELRYGVWESGTEHMSPGSQITMGLLGIGTIAWGIAWLGTGIGAIVLIGMGGVAVIMAIVNPGYGAELPEVLPIPDKIHPDSDRPEGPFIGDSSPADGAIDPSGYVCEGWHRTE